MSLSFILLINEVYPSHRPQITGLIAKNAFIKIFAKYVDFADVFSPNLISKLFEYTRINNYAIKLVNNQQPPYKLIYSLGLIKLKALKTYIEINLVNEFIRLFNLSAVAPIFFN